MTNPVDDLGNPRVDFVWGNVPLQPDDQRPNSGPITVYVGNDSQNRQWDPEAVFPSTTLQTEVYQALSVGDQNYDANWMEPTLRYVPVPADNAKIAIDGYENFPGFTRGGVYDDLISNTTVPNIIGLDFSAATTALTNANLGGSGNDVTEGATSENDGLIATQNPAAGTLVNSGGIVSFTKYSYLVPNVPDLSGLPWPEAETQITNAGFVSGGAVDSTRTGATETNANCVFSQSPAANTYATPGSTITYVTYDFLGYDIAGIRWNAALDSGSGGYDIFITGRTNRPTVDTTIYLNGTGQDIDGGHTVLAVVNDDSFNTGGTKISITKDSSTYTGAQIVNTGVWSRTNLW